MNSAVQLVWFKRDLRIDDHRPLAEAARRGPVLPVYVVEPGYWRQPDTAARHQAFIAESLADLHRALSDLGQGLVVEVGELPEVFERLHARFGFAAIHAHEETGTDWTFARDRRVRAWCREKGIGLHEYPQFGVQRGLKDRDGWAKRWVPELAEVPTEAIFEPWKLGQSERRACGALDYPEPVVDHLAASRAARKAIGEHRKRPGFRKEADRVQHELGSRRSGLPPSGRRKKVKKKKADAASRQGVLF